MVEIRPGSRKDRESVYNDLINKANVELKDLHDNLYKWNFTWSRLTKYNFRHPDPCLQWDAFKGKMEKWLKGDPSFAFEFDSFVQQGCRHGMIREGDVEALWRMLVGESREIKVKPKAAASVPQVDGTEGKGDGDKGQVDQVPGNGE